MKPEKILKNLSKAARLALYQPSHFLTRIKAKLVLPLCPDLYCDISVNGIRFHIDPSVAPMMKEICYGFYETEVKSILGKYLREGDVCIDVGANIGYLTAFMASLVGKSGQVHSFEPVPEYFARLAMVRDDNSEYSILINAAALGERPGTAEICVTNRENIGWNTMVPNFMRPSTVKEKLKVPVIRLDEYIQEKGLPGVRLIKIDTEGFELPVIKGMSNFLSETNVKPIIIAEIAPNAYPKLGTSLGELTALMDNHKYRPFSTETLKPINVNALTATTNVLYLPPSVQ